MLDGQEDGWIMVEQMDSWKNEQKNRFMMDSYITGRTNGQYTEGWMATDTKKRWTTA